MYFGEAATQSAVSLSRSERKKHKALNSFSVEILLLMIFSSFKKKCDFIFSLSSFFFFQFFFQFFFCARYRKCVTKERGREKKGKHQLSRGARRRTLRTFFFLSRERARGGAEAGVATRRGETKRDRDDGRAVPAMAVPALLHGAGHVSGPGANARGTLHQPDGPVSSKFSFLLSSASSRFFFLSSLSLSLSRFFLRRENNSVDIRVLSELVC